MLIDFSTHSTSNQHSTISIFSDRHCYMLRSMFKRQKTGSVVCPSCGSLVGVNDEQCYTCGRRNPGLWGFAPLLRRLGNDFGFVPLVTYGCSALYVAGLVV